MITVATALPLALALLATPPEDDRFYDPPDRGAPGDEAIQEAMAARAKTLDARFLEGIASQADWERVRPELQEQYFHMLGLDPRPERTPLHATVTGKVDGEGFVVEKLHYQSRPGLYVTANLYRPETIEPGQKLPAILYVCGHSPMGRDGNKTAYQSHGIWFARHGYICLVLDSLQLGEIAGIHHGTYREGRWWWHSRGYTPAGVECWNGVRGIDYLVERPDVDRERIGVTGISGGGAATFWISSADDRVRAAAPVSGMADLESYVGNRVINGHCDCMFLYNTFEWPWTNIAALIAPRPMLFVNSDADPIFPMDANERVIARLERLYSRFGASDKVDAVVSIGGHAYRRDIREAVYRFMNIYLKGDPSPIRDSEVDAVSSQNRAERSYPIEPSRLRVFPTDDDLPKDALNGRIDELFVPRAEVSLPEEGGYAAWRDALLAELRRVSFRPMGERAPVAQLRGSDGADPLPLAAGDGPTFFVHQPGGSPAAADVRRVLLVVDDGADGVDAVVSSLRRDGDAVYRVAPRGVGRSRWTRKDPPNYVERSLVLLGQTADGGRVLDLAATARLLRRRHGEHKPIVAAGRGTAGLLAAYAALLEPDISSVTAIDVPASHMDKGAPQFLNVLRVLDVPEALGLLAPRLLSLRGEVNPALADRVKAIYARAEAADQLEIEAP